MVARRFLVCILLLLAPAPAGLAGAPIELSPGVHPLVDRRLIAELRDARHVLHPPVPRETILKLDRPWEGMMSGYGTIMRDAQGKVRLYYRGGGDVDPPEVTCVALSDDGITFERPILKLYEIRGTRENNVVFTAADRLSYGESHNLAPFLDTNPAAPPEAQWKAVALRSDTDERGEKRKMLAVLGSADGLRWKHLSDRPVIREGSFDSLNLAFFDSHSAQYVCYFRVGRGGLRSFGRAHSKDFLSWTIDGSLEFRPPQEEHWYTNGVMPYPQVPGLYVALPMRFVPARKSVGDPPRMTDGLSDAVMMTSRDGVRWDRCFREALVRPGPDPANWGDAHGNNTPLAGMIETAKGEWSVYWFEGYGTKKPRIRRGTVRTHGLASIRAGADGGEMLTPPLRMNKSAELHINFATSATGSIRVEVLDEHARPLDGFAASDCAEIYGDEPSRIVRWKGNSPMPADRVFRLRFVLRDADLFTLIVL